MSDPALAPRLPPHMPPHMPARIANASVFVATFTCVIVAIGVLLTADLFLARVDRRETDARAASEYAAGASLLRAGRPADAAEQFGAAVAVDRGNVNYALALAEAMLEDGRTADAEATLRALLDRAENDGAVNLVMAHVMLRERRESEAKAYFHRAIFGRWGADSTAQRMKARTELIDMLARTGAARELLAELLPFEEVAPDSVPLHLRLGQLYLLAGSPARAANQFRVVLRQNANDADAYAGMGEAALALGNFRTARADLAEASRLNPGDSHIANRAALVDTILALDPTARGIGAHDRYDRTRALLARTSAALSTCAAPETPAADSARSMLSRRTKPSGEDAATDDMLALSVDAWAARPASCSATGNDEALRLLFNHVAP